MEKNLIIKTNKQNKKLKHISSGKSIKNFYNLSVLKKNRSNSKNTFNNTFKENNWNNKFFINKLPPYSIENDKYYLNIQEMKACLKGEHNHYNPIYSISLGNFENESNNENIKILISLWDELGVTIHFRQAFVLFYNKLNEDAKKDLIKNEINNLKKLDELLAKLNKETYARDKAIKNLNNFSFNVKKTIETSSLDQIIKQVILNIKNLRILSINIVNHIIKIRELMSYSILCGKFDSQKLLSTYNYNKNYLVKMQYDLDFLKCSQLNEYFNFSNSNDPFFMSLSEDVKNEKYKVNIDNEMIESIKICHANIFNDIILYQQNLIKQNKYHNHLYPFVKKSHIKEYEKCNLYSQGNIDKESIFNKELSVKIKNCVSNKEENKALEKYCLNIDSNLKEFNKINNSYLKSNAKVNCKKNTTNYENMLKKDKELKKIYLKNWDITKNYNYKKHLNKNIKLQPIIYNTSRCNKYIIEKPFSNIDIYPELFKNKDNEKLKELKEDSKTESKNSNSKFYYDKSSFKEDIKDKTYNNNIERSLEEDEFNSIIKKNSFSCEKSNDTSIRDLKKHNDVNIESKKLHYNNNQENKDVSCKKELKNAFESNFVLIKTNNSNKSIKSNCKNSINENTQEFNIKSINEENIFNSKEEINNTNKEIDCSSINSNCSKKLKSFKIDSKNDLDERNTHIDEKYPILNNELEEIAIDNNASIITNSNYNCIEKNVISKSSTHIKYTNIYDKDTNKFKSDKLLTKKFSLSFYDNKVKNELKKNSEIINHVDTENGDEIIVYKKSASNFVNLLLNNISDKKRK